MTHILNDANVTAQWYQMDYPGAEFFDKLEKFCLHTTETMGWPGYSQGAVAPNATYHPRLRQIRQHFDSDRSSRALVDPANTPVRENRDNIFQLEIIAYSDYAQALAVGGLWIGDLAEEHYVEIAEMLQQLHIDLGLPLEASVAWREGRKTYYNDVRLSSAQFDAYRGILGHVHVSGNVHWDPGGFYISKLMAALEDINLDWNDEVVKNLDTGNLLEVDQALSFIYTRQLRAEKQMDLVQADLTAIKTALVTPPPVAIDYDTLATKVVERLATTTELGFRPAT